MDIPHHLLDPERDHDAAELIARYSPSAADWPLVVTLDGSVLRNPGESEIARALGMIGAAAADKLYDAAIVGCGPAGLATAVYAASEGLSVVVLRCPRFWRPGRRQRAHRELSRFSHRHFGTGAGRPGVHAGAEIRRRHHDSHGRQGARLHAREWRICLDA